MLTFATQCLKMNSNSYFFADESDRSEQTIPGTDNGGLDSLTLR